VSDAPRRVPPPLRPLQRLSVRTFAALRRWLQRAGDWIDARPGLARWVYPREDADLAADYGAFNGRMFADFHEHERMLSDRPRMAFYQAAIARQVRPGDHVIDLGTGTGILAALAARAGAGTVHALDHSEILDHARTLAQANGVANVTFVATHSTAFTLDRRVDVIVHEQMGDCLFDEAMVTNVSDLRKRLLKPGGRIVPAGFDWFCEPVRIRDDRVVPFLWEINAAGYDYSSLARHRPHDPRYYRAGSSDATLVAGFLGQPAPALTFDLHTADDTTLPRELRLVREVTSPGRLDGYAVYFRARVDADLTLDTSPLNPGRAPHWGYRILRTDARTVAAGDRLVLHLQVERWSDPDTWRWQVDVARGRDPV
jgi:protein arginine N-methyltransferase 1